MNHFCKARARDSAQPAQTASNVVTASYQLNQSSVSDMNLPLNFDPAAKIEVMSLLTSMLIRWGTLHGIQLHLRL